MAVVVLWRWRCLWPAMRAHLHDLRAAAKDHLMSSDEFRLHCVRPSVARTVDWPENTADDRPNMADNGRRWLIIGRRRGPAMAAPPPPPQPPLGDQNQKRQNKQHSINCIIKLGQMPSACHIN